MADEERTPAQERAAQEEDDRFARRRYEAREYGFTREQAEEFAASDWDLWDLRRLVAGNCPVALAVRILAKV